MTPPIEQALSNAPAVRASKEALGPDDRAWIVGGAIRDAALGREVVDVDLAVGRDEEGIARRVASAGGGPAFQLSDQFATWRALDRNGAWHVDVARLRGEAIEADLGLRDFTLNKLDVSTSVG